MLDIFKIALKLFVITAVAALALGLTHAITEEPIEQQIQEANIQARKAVLPQGEEFEALDISKYQEQYPEIIEAYEGKKGTDTVGYTFIVECKGFGGIIEVFVGISTDEHKVEGIQIGNHQETPGLGAKVTEPGFVMQYTGKPVTAPLAVVKGVPSKEQEVEAITGATITSKAVTQGVNTVTDFYNRVLKDGGGDK
jgi:electron transport complex protein RnfG